MSGTVGYIVRSKPAVLVTGATGFVGRAVCTALSTDWTVYGLTRSRVPADMNRAWIPICAGDLRDGSEWERALPPVQAVVHLAARCHILAETSPDPWAEFHAVNVVGTERLAKWAVKAGVRRFLFLSSVGVHGTSTERGKSFSETDAPMPRTLYGRSKWEAEQALRNIAEGTGMSTTIVRAPLVYGPNVAGNFLTLLKYTYRRVPLPLLSVTNRRSLLSVANAASFVKLCLPADKACGETFLISDDEDISTESLLRRLGEHMGRRARLFWTPGVLLRSAARVTGRSHAYESLCESLVVRTEKARRLLGWKPPQTLTDGLKLAARWYVDSAPQG
jgi:nucleoside-diphosphate-sugar epimerase